MSQLKNKWIRICQELHFAKSEKIQFNRVVLFLVPGNDVITGGIISIAGIYKSLKSCEQKLGINCYVCTQPLNDNLLHFKGHNQDLTIYNFHSILRKLLPDSELLIHVPESHILQTIRCLRQPVFKKLLDKKNINLSLNILNQNPNYFDPTAIMPIEFEFFKSVSITNAHFAYTKPINIGGRIIESFYLGVPNGQDSMLPMSFEHKENLILLSHDLLLQDEDIPIQKLKNSLPEFRFRTIKNMSYLEYKRLQQKAKWCITFGEGLDFYFMDSYFYGGISLAVFNDLFFTSDFKELDSVFTSTEEMMENAAKIIRQHSEPKKFAELNKTGNIILSKYYSTSKYHERVYEFHAEWIKTISNGNSD